MTTRCSLTDLLVGECGGACCRPDLVEVTFVPVVIEGTYTQAQHPGYCACGCGRAFDRYEDIVKAELGDSPGNRQQGWCLPECTRSATPWS